MTEIFIENRAFLTAILVALIGAFITFRIHRYASVRIIKKGFSDFLAADISTLRDPKNASRDAYSILEPRFVFQHEEVIKVLYACGCLCKYRLSKAWKNYYGEDGEQEWWLSNEYSSLFTNQLKNTIENTKQLAIHRLTYLIKLCS